MRRPEVLIRHLYESYCVEHDLDDVDESPTLGEIPILVKEPPIVIKDVVMSKLHSAILTTDPISNLYVCGVGRGGRLGLGEENTQYRFVPVQGPLAERKIHEVALGQNHSLAVTSNGELWSWGLNTDCQLGYILPTPPKADEEAMCTTPRQVFGSLKKETVLGIAASAIHSVAHTGTSLYCWGRNAGQLALMDSDSRSLEFQTTPRKVAASLLSAPIESVSAIDRATTCLLANHTVWVFTNYGYNLVKFPLPDVFANFNSTSFTTRYDSRRKEISYVTSGGETIAAVTASGDLFTMHVSQKGDLTQSATSTTNPTKIKGALSQPQCIWDSRKDGVVSISVGEHGSVIICTQSGAVWKRVKRSKGKSAAFSGSIDAKRKDFKFERVPYITNCVGARSSTFGAFAAIRKDSSVMAEEIKVKPPTLWDDISSLMCLTGFEASIVKEGRTAKAWEEAIAREQPRSISYEVLRSADIERDLLEWFKANYNQLEGFDMEVCSSTSSGIKLPMHSWALSARSPVLREVLAELENPDVDGNSSTFTVTKEDGKTLLTFIGVDIYTVLSVVVFLYQDSLIPVWKYTRDMPSHAYRFRQVRTELMRIATALRLPKLEAAARLQTTVEPSLDADFQLAMADPLFFHDGDVIIELDDDEVYAHSTLLCQRCPFFEGMFYGRSRGQWLAGRRQGLSASDPIRVDLKHMKPESFHYVMASIYGDLGPHMFDSVTATDMDEFSELVLDVMGAANELMLDRLSQICQSVIGKFVTTRNISLLLNEISPCSVTDFKDTGLEYICLQLESMLENHLLDDLEDDLLMELDETVRDNQLSHFPFVRSGRAKLLLHEKYPDLAADIDEERQIRIKELAYKAAQRDEDKKLSSSFKTRFGSFDDLGTPSPTSERVRRKSKAGRNEPFSPTLRPKKSAAEMIFDMDDDATPGASVIHSPELRLSDEQLGPEVDNLPQLPKSWQYSRGKDIARSVGSPLGSTTPVRTPLSPELRPQVEASPQLRPIPESTRNGGSPWASATLATSKLDLKGIMSETRSGSALSAGLEAQRAKDSALQPKSQTKMSQKERKKQLQVQAEAQAAEKAQQASHTPWEKVSSGRQSTAPWKAAPQAPKTSLKEIAAADAAAAAAKPLVASETNPKSSRLRTASPDTRFPGQGRTNSSPAVPSSSGTRQPQKRLVPHSQSYITPAPKAEAEIGLSMADIIGQQRREQELHKEAVAKRSLQEIQQEQEFQQWWDQESRRAQEEEARRQSKGRKQEENVGQRGRRGRGGKPRANEGGSTQQPAKEVPSDRPGEQFKRGKGVKGRGRKA